MKNIKMKTKITIATIMTFIVSCSMVPINVNAAAPEFEMPTVSIVKISDEVLTSESSLNRSASFVNLAEEIAPGQVIEGKFTLTNLFGTNLTVIASASNTGGSLGFAFVSAYYQIPCDGVGRVITRETGWSRGTYSYHISNNTGNKTRVALNIYEP